MISVQNLSKQYGHQVIFDKISFSVNPCERVGLVGRNGHGKTTLLKLLIQQEPYDEGSIISAKNYRIGHLNQHIHFSKMTVLEEGCCGLPKDQESEQWKVKKVLSGLGFSERDFERSPAELSGGYQIRLSLAKVLVSEPNLLLLDEPTNFLDILSIRWLIRFLTAWRNEMIVISHDRGFMDHVTTHIMGIHRSKIRKIAGSPDDYYDQIAKEEEVHEKQRINDEKKRKQMDQFINRFRAKARQANLVQSRIKTIEKQEKLEKLEEIRTLSFSFNAAPFSAKCILEAQDITFSYDGNPPYLIDQFTLTIQNHDKICIIGKNGKGKTTLLKLLAGELVLSKGQVRNHPQAKRAYFGQTSIATLNNEMTVEEEILSSHSNGDKKAAWDICGAMMFSGDKALKKIDVLSGGEKSRVVLGKMLISPANLLMLDEPTHHLDMESCEAMVEALALFQGAAIIVTHNERFLHKIANKLIVFHQDRLFLFHGGYSQFLDRIGWGDQEDISSREQLCRQKDKPGENLTKKDMRKVRADFIAKRSRTLNPYKQKMEELEKRVEEMEAQLGHDTQSLIEASHAQDRSAIEKLSKSLRQTRTHVDTLYEQLTETSQKYEQKKLIFDQEDSTL